jgi:hypothetical protein
MAGSKQKRGKSAGQLSAVYPLAAGIDVGATYSRFEDSERTSSGCPKTRPSGCSAQEFLERGAALTSRLQSFETKVSDPTRNLAGLARINRGVIPPYRLHRDQPDR